MPLGLFKLEFVPNYPVCNGEYIFIKYYTDLGNGLTPEEKQQIKQWAIKTVKDEFGAYRVINTYETCWQEPTLTYICDTAYPEDWNDEDAHYNISVQTGEY